MPPTGTATNGDTEGDINADINFIQGIGSEDQYGCAAASAGQTLDGFDDWAHIQYNPRLNAMFFGDGARPNLPPELTATDVRAISQKADLKVSKSADQTDAVGGDTVSYSVGVTNLGPGTATNISITDTLPDATTQQRSLPNLSNGGVNNITPKFTYLVPCATTDGTGLIDWSP